MLDLAQDLSNRLIQMRKRRGGSATVSLAASINDSIKRSPSPRSRKTTSVGKPSFIYRVHEQPKSDRLRQFFDFITNFGIMIKGTGEASINDSIKRSPSPRSRKTTSVGKPSLFTNTLASLINYN
jgi:hypothetical protein